VEISSPNSCFKAGSGYSGHYQAETQKSPTMDSIISGQCTLVLSSSRGEEVLPSTQLGPCLLQLVSAASCSLVLHLGEEYGSIFSLIPF